MSIEIDFDPWQILYNSKQNKNQLQRSLIWAKKKKKKKKKKNSPVLGKRGYRHFSQFTVLVILQKKKWMLIL